MQSKHAAAVPSLQVDDERVRVTQWTFTPGAKTGWHRHEYAYVVVPLTTGTLRLHGAEGITEAKLTLGQSYSRPAGIEHDVENANTFDFAFVEVELKDRPLAK
jgi:quercetin dioxygenase-like cupin family protein